jgi:AcrR family transcriptional regulator
MARTKEQNESMRNSRRKKIRSAALTQFVRQGLFATRIQDIAREAGIAQGLLYHYYPSKEAIYVDLINDALDKTIAASEMVLKMDLPPDKKIRFALEELLKTIETSSAFLDTCRLIAQATNTTVIPAENRHQIEAKRSRPYTIIAEIMAAGQEEGTIVPGDSQMLAVLFWTSINGLAIYYGSSDHKGPIPDAALLASMFLLKKAERGENHES